MIRSRALRSGLISTALVLVGVAAWLTLAPTGIGGSADYVTTHGESMAPRFHTGDLAVIRPSDDYRVGDVVAYRSTLLRTVVLHRIMGRTGDRYVFKGDNNDFVDPTHPDRSELIGKLALRVPRGGIVLGWLHLPLVSGGLLGGVALMLLLGGQSRRRRRRPPVAPLPPALPAAAPPPPHAPASPPHAPASPAPHAPASPRPLTAMPPVAALCFAAPPAPAPVARVEVPAPVAPTVAAEIPAPVAPAPTEPEPAPRLALAPAPLPAARAPRFDGRQILIASAVAAVIFAVAALFAFITPTTRTTIVKEPYSQDVSFRYHAAATPKAGPVYPGGALSTGDPVFLKLVDRVKVGVGYRFTAEAPHRLAGTMDVLLRISNQNGWSYDMPLAPATPFDGDRAESEVTLDLARIRSLTRRVEKLTGMPANGTYALAVVPRVHASGTLSGQPLRSELSPQTTFQLDALQLRPGGDEPSPKRAANVPVPHTVANAFGVRGQELPVALARWIALGGLLLALIGALLSRLERFRRAADPSGRVQARYGHLIVPIVAITPNPTQVPVDVTTIDALVALAERVERLILHHRADEADTYLVDDGHTLFRFRIRHAAADRPLAATG